MWEELKAELEEFLGTSVQKSSSVSGGCINQCLKLETGRGSFFLKMNDPDRFPGMFAAEAEGLRELERTGAIRVPKVIGQADSWLLLEWLDNAPRHTRYWEAFGKQLANLHRQSSRSFGLDSDNYIGSLPQSNRKSRNWPEFFASERLIPQMHRAADSGLLDQALTGDLERLIDRLPMLLPEEAPALLHGDLWSGNFLDGPEGFAALVDPAVYYGCREVDLAMSRLFGGFDSRFYEAYHESFPLLPGWERRMDLHNIYPLLVHVNLFGGSYVGSLRSVTRQFL